MQLPSRPIEPLRQALPYVPVRFADETLWSWMTRVALYYGWRAEDFVRMLSDEETAWESAFRDPDLDVAPPGLLLSRLAACTDIPEERLQSWCVPRTSSLLWMDDRTCFCPACFSMPGAIPYVRRAWLDAWVVDCDVHRRPLISVARTHRALRLPDWSAAWGSERGWAAATHVRLRRREEGTRVEIPPTLNRIRHRWSAWDETASIAVYTARPESAFERSLVMMAGDGVGGFSLARMYYELREDLRWRNTPGGFDRSTAVSEPLGSLTLRACAISIGASLYDLLTGATVRDPDTANPLRTAISDLHGKPREWLMSIIKTWPSAYQGTWIRLFDWPVSVHSQNRPVRSVQ